MLKKIIVLFITLSIIFLTIVLVKRIKLRVFKNYAIKKVIKIKRKFIKYMVGLEEYQKILIKLK